MERLPLQLFLFFILVLILLTSYHIFNLSITGNAVLTSTSKIQSQLPTKIQSQQALSPQLGVPNFLYNFDSDLKDSVTKVLATPYQTDARQAVKYDTLLGRKSLRIDQTSAGVKLPDTQKVGNLDTYTLETTFYLDTSMKESEQYPWYPIISEYTGGSARGNDKGRYLLSLTSPTHLVFSINTNGVITNLISVSGIYEKTWTNVVIVVDNTKPKQKVKLYINGELKRSSDTYTMDKKTTDYSLLVGALPNSYGTVAPIEYFSGFIDDVTIYKRAITEEEVKNLANQAFIKQDEKIGGLGVIIEDDTTSNNKVVEIRKKTHDILDIIGLEYLLDASLLTPAIYTTDGTSCKSVCEKASNTEIQLKCYKAYETNGAVSNCDSVAKARTCQCLSTQFTVNAFVKKHVSSNTNKNLPPQQPLSSKGTLPPTGIYPQSNLAPDLNPKGSIK